MLTRQILKLPWFISTPVLVLGALALAVVLQAVAGTYFERTFRDDADPLAGLTRAGATPSVAASPSAALTVPSTVAATGAPILPSSAGQAATPAPAAAAVTSVPAGTVVAPAVPAAALTPPPPAGPALLREGSFVDGDPGHNGRGRARLIRTAEGATILRFEDFSVTNGPDLFVILSTDPAGSRASAAGPNALDLGRLKATNGNINYDVPDGVDITPYHSVIIYCRAFKVVFAVATLGGVQ